MEDVRSKARPKRIMDAKISVRIKRSVLDRIDAVTGSIFGESRTEIIRSVLDMFFGDNSSMHRAALNILTSLFKNPMDGALYTLFRMQLLWHSDADRMEYATDAASMIKGLYIDATESDYMEEAYRAANIDIAPIRALAHAMDVKSLHDEIFTAVSAWQGLSASPAEGFVDAPSEKGEQKLDAGQEESQQDMEAGIADQNVPPVAVEAEESE